MYTTQHEQKQLKQKKLRGAAQQGNIMNSAWIRLADASRLQWYSDEIHGAPSHGGLGSLGIPSSS